MSWAVGYDSKWKRDIGYEVPARCDFPKCSSIIDRGLSYVCGSEPFGGERGCGLYFCSQHLFHTWGEEPMVTVCMNCIYNRPPHKPTPDIYKWSNHKLTDPSWKEWRDANPEEVEKIKHEHDHRAGRSPAKPKI